MEGSDTTDGSSLLQMSSDYERWQVSLFSSSLPFTPLGKHSARVTTPEDIYMEDLTQLSNLEWVFCALLHKWPLGFILLNFDNLI